MTVPVYASDGTATARSAARSARPSRTTRRAMEKAGIAARDINTAFVVFTAAYASGRRSNRAYAGLIRSGYTTL